MRMREITGWLCVLMELYSWSYKYTYGARAYLEEEEEEEEVLMLGREAVLAGACSPLESESSPW
jgi:hypothetical protein